MTDELIVGGYDFTDILQLFDPGMPAIAEWALDEWTSNPSARAWPFVNMHSNAERVINAQIVEATEAAARTELASIVAACVPGAVVQWRPAGQSAFLSATVITAAITTDVRDVRIRGLQSQGVVGVTISLVTSPYWLGAEVETTLDVAGDGTPFVATIPDVAGDVPALTRLRLTHAQATTMQAIALHSNADAAFSPIQDYTGASDATAYGGTCTAAVHGTGTPTTLGTPTSLDVAAHRGDYLVMARVKTEAAVANTYYRAISTVQGSIGSAYSVYGSEVNPVTTASAGWDVLDLGVMPLPAGRVQAGLSGMSYGPNTTQYTIADASGTYFARSKQPTQTFTPTNSCKVSSVTVAAYGTGTDIGCYIITTNSGGPFQYRLLTSSVGYVSLPASEADVTIPVNEVELTAGVKYAVVLVPRSNSTSWYVSKGAATSGETAYDTTGQSAADLGYDLRLIVTGGTLITVGATIGVQERCTTSSKDTMLDVVTLLPTSEACVKVTTAASAGAGVCIDYLSDNDADHDVYIADATSTGVSVIAGVEPYGGPLLLRPGSNTLVGVMATPVNAAPGDASLLVTYRPRYLLPYAEV